MTNVWLPEVGALISRADVLRQAHQFFAAGDFEAAERVLTGVWPSAAQTPAPALTLLGHIRWKQRRIPEAERLFRRAIRAEPTAPSHHGALGDLLASVGAWSYAVDVYVETLRLDPGNAAVSASLARSLLGAGRPTEAEHAARHAIELEPSKAPAWETLARALAAEDRLEEALAAIEESLQLDPDRLSATLEHADLLARTGRNEEALTTLEASVAKGRAAPALTVARGAILSNLTRLAEAATTFAEGVSRWPDNTALQNSLARARWMLGEGDDFTRDIEAAVVRNPDDIRMRLACANLLRLGDYRERSETLLRDGLARNPEDPALLQSLGVLLDEMDRTADGLPLIQQALERTPQTVHVRANLVCALLRLGRGDEALREIEPARRAEPLNQEWICYETMALRQMGHPRYRELCDYDLMVRPYFLSPPPGFANIEAFNEALADSLKRLHVLEAHPLDQSVRGGSQTSRSLIHVDDPIIQAFLRALDEPIRAYLDAMGTPDPNHPWSGRKTGKYRLTGSWSVRLKPDGYHINHVHPAGWISGPYYVSVPKVVAEGEGQQGWVTFGAPRWPTPGCTAEKIVQPKAGLQVLFPSYMWHGTIPFSEGERITAPLDAAPA